MIVNFVFEGDGTTASASLQVTRAHLGAKPDSFLSILSSEEWNQNSQAGATSETAIVCRPLQTFPDCWSTEIVSMIESAYKNEELVLPETVELEEAMNVLDFYGLAPALPEDIRISDNLPFQLKLRAKLFVLNVDALCDAMEDCYERLERAPKFSTVFLFSCQDLDHYYMQEANKGPFVRLRTLVIPMNG